MAEEQLAGIPGMVPTKNTDTELYRERTGEPAGDYYENSLFVTKDGKIGMNVGGLVFVASIADWHSMMAAGHVNG